MTIVEHVALVFETSLMMKKEELKLKIKKTSKGKMIYTVVQQQMPAMEDSKELATNIMTEEAADPEIIFCDARETSHSWKDGILSS